MATPEFAGDSKHWRCFNEVRQPGKHSPKNPVSPNYQYSLLHWHATCLLLPAAFVAAPFMGCSKQGSKAILMLAYRRGQSSTQHVQLRPCKLARLGLIGKRSTGTYESAAFAKRAWACC
jgi:hypothetical protein